MKGTGAETGTTIEVSDDEYGYKWVILRDDDLEDLVVSVNAVADNLSVGGYGDRLLAAVFAFEEDGRPVYFIYNSPRAYYPPSPPQARRVSVHRARVPPGAQQLGSDLPLCFRARARWFPLEILSTGTGGTPARDRLDAARRHRGETFRRLNQSSNAPVPRLSLRVLFSVSPPRSSLSTRRVGFESCGRRQPGGDCC